MDKILILDFGGQTTQLIGRRIRDAGVYAEIMPGDEPLDEKVLRNVRGIVLSGSPRSAYESGAPLPHASVYRTGLPILGICYGLQATVHVHGGTVESLGRKEYGRARVFVKGKTALLDGVPDGFVSWMSHGDSISSIPSGFKVVAETENGLPCVVENVSLRFTGLQFHPEVTHCEHGDLILANFAVRIAGASRDWTMDAYLGEEQEEIRRRVGKENVLLLISGGVDSSVVAGLLLKTLDPAQVFLMYIDTGLMRKNETAEVEANLKTLGAKHLHLVNAERAFLDALAGIADPEEKRRRIGDLFMKVQEQEIRERGIGEGFLAQGTLYTDMIESGKGVGQKAAVIKSHHNVGTPLVDEKRKKGRVIEPLARLYKDEVRVLGRLLGLSEGLIGRHPFPGPGLAIRILSDVTKEKCDILREADALYIGELKRRGLYDKIWQAFCVLLPVRSVGVTGDERKYSYVLSLRAVVSKDGMTADVYPFSFDELLEISSLITNRVPEIGRVVYDITSKPPGTIEWE